MSFTQCSYIDDCGVTVKVALYDFSRVRTEGEKEVNCRSLQQGKGEEGTEEGKGEGEKGPRVEQVLSTTNGSFLLCLVGLVRSKNGFQFFCLAAPGSSLEFEEIETGKYGGLTER